MQKFRAVDSGDRPLGASPVDSARQHYRAGTQQALRKRTGTVFNKPRKGLAHAWFPPDSLCRPSQHGKGKGKVAQSCPTLCDPCRPPQHEKVKAVQSCPTLCDPMDCTAVQSMEFSRPEYWSG